MSATAVEPGRRTPVDLLTVVIVGDDLVRGALKALLEVQDDMCVVGEADTASGGLGAIARNRADVAIVDARLPDRSGYELCRVARERHPATRVLILTSFGDHGAVSDAIRAGAAGYVLKHVRCLDLPLQVRRVAHADRRPALPAA